MKPNLVNRRDFLKSTALFTAACACSQAASEEEIVRPGGIPIGLQLYAVRGEFEKDVPATLRSSAAAGYKGVEFWGYAGTPSIFGLHLAVSGKDLILVLGGLFLLAKSTYEIHEKIEGHEASAVAPAAPTFASVVVQIMLLDIVFSLDSVITAVGMVNKIGVMVAAVIIAMAVMIIFVNRIAAFVERHPTIKMLALSFLILIGTMLVAEGFHQHINKGYIYFAMFFALAVEALNIRVRVKSQRAGPHVVHPLPTAPHPAPTPASPPAQG